MLDLIINKVDSPAVCISGGIDSTVILHHVFNTCSNVRTYTAIFGNDEDEADKARRVSECYGTKHKEVLITKSAVLNTLEIDLKYYPFPRYNLWPWIVVNSVKLDNAQHLFIGEGADEIFGYSDRSFFEGWAGQVVWVWPSWKGACDYYRVKLHAPFMSIRATTNFYLPPNKELLRTMYKGAIPDFVLKQSSTPPSKAFYKMMGMTKEELQIEACKLWLKARNL